MDAHQHCVCPVLEILLEIEKPELAFVQAAGFGRKLKMVGTRRLRLDLEE